MITTTLIIFGILLLLFLIFIFSGALFGILFSIGKKQKDIAYYDPEIKKWIPLSMLTYEQQSRMVDGSRKLRKRKNKIKAIMTIQELRNKYGIYFDTFWLDPFFPSEQKDTWFTDEGLTEEGLSYFLKWKEGLIKFEDMMKEEHYSQYPIIKEGKALCPICGKEVYVDPEHELPRYVINHYYCSNCNYTLRSHLIFKEAKIEDKVLEFLKKIHEEI